MRVLITMQFLLHLVTSCDLSPNPQSSAGKAELRKIAEAARPIITAVQDYRRQHRRLPENPEQIGLTYPPAFGEWFCFFDDEHSYRMFCQTGWDPMNGLWFKYSDPDELWWYDPGDGSPIVDLTSEFSKP